MLAPSLDCGPLTGSLLLRVLDSKLNTRRMWPKPHRVKVVITKESVMSHSTESGPKQMPNCMTRLLSKLMLIEPPLIVCTDE